MTTMLLKNLIDNLNSKISNLKIRKISADSRKIQKGDLFVSIKGNKFDAQNLNKFFSQKSNNNVFKNISKNIDIRFKNISTPLSKKMSNFRLIGTIKNGEFIKISSKGDFEQDKFLDITLKSDKNNKKKIFRNLF